MGGNSSRVVKHTKELTIAGKLTVPFFGASAVSWFARRPSP